MAIAAVVFPVLIAQMRLNLTDLIDTYVVVQFYPWLTFYFLLFWGMVMSDNEFETKRTNLNQGKIESQYICQKCEIWMWQYIVDALESTKSICGRNPNLQVFIMHVSHICSQYSCGLPLRINGMHITHFGCTHFDLWPLVIWSCMFWPSVMWNLCKAQCWSKNLRSLSPALFNLWLLLVLGIESFYLKISGIHFWKNLYAP